MPKSVIVLFLALAAPGLAREPYRPLPRLSDDEVKRRKAEAPPAPSAPPDEPSASAPTEPPLIAPGAPAAPERLPPGPDVTRRPRVDAGWKPYHRGQWVWTDAGWTPLWLGWPFFSVGFAPSFRFFTFVPSYRFHRLPVHRFAIAPRFHGGLVPWTFPAARPAPRMARGPAWGGP